MSSSAAQDYQEVLTNFPLGSQVLTGLFLDVTLSGPEGPPQTYERALVDRIGYAARQNGGTPNVSIDPDGAPTLSEFDMFTLQVLPSLQDTSAVVRLKDELNALTQQESNQLAQNPDPVASATGFENLLRALTVYKSILFLGSSDEATNELASASGVKAYFDRPRLILVSNESQLSSDPQQLNLLLAIDLRRDTIRAVPIPGQVADAGFVFNLDRGVVENVTEAGVLTGPASNGSIAQAVSTATIFQAAQAQGISLVVIGANNLPVLATLDISAEAKARITTAVQNGNDVVVPRQAVTMGNTATIGWYEINRSTGESIGVTENGDTRGWWDGPRSWVWRLSC